MTHRSTRSPSLERFWRKHVAQQRVSNRTIHAYCQQRKLSAGQFSFWKHELKRRDQESARPVFVELESSSSTSVSETPIELVLANHRRLLVRPGCHLPLLQQVLHLLEDRSC